MNYNTPERREQLETARRRERRLLRSAVNFIKEAVMEDEEVEVYFEWPWPCFGWKQHALMELSEFFSDHGIPWLPCRIDGCNYGMRDKDDNLFVKKQWLIRTTSEQFHKVFRAKICPGNHGQHSPIQGMETARTSYYPWKMVQAITRHWSRQYAPERHLHLLEDLVDQPALRATDDLLTGAETAGSSQSSPPHLLPAPVEATSVRFTGETAGSSQSSHPHLLPAPVQPNEAFFTSLSGSSNVFTTSGTMLGTTPQLPEGVTKNEYDRRQANVARFHKAAGHPTNRNLARIIEDAGHPRWKVEVALHHSCPACLSLRSEGTSSGQVPPVSTHQQYEAWMAIAVDSAEWIPPGRRIKVKFLVMMDVATKLRVVQPLFTYGFLEMRTESGQDFIRAFSERWLSTFPKPQVVLLDSAKSFVSQPVQEFFSQLNILTHYVAEKESWAHGTVEATVQDVKHTASAIFLENLDVAPDIVLHLAAAALNATEYTAGYSAFQWAYGTSYNITDEDQRTFHQVQPRVDFTRLVVGRQKAEEIARSTRAKRALTKLNNTTVRQPLRSYSPMDLVKVWRRVWPQEQHKGPRSGFKKSGRPHWVGPGRVVFSEVLPHQKDHEDVRRHVVWVLIGTQLLRCSVHSVRPVTEVERFQFETTSGEQPSRWKSLADVMPRREYFDLLDDEPEENEREHPPLPPAPDDSTVVAPTRRLRQKVTFKPGEYVDKPVAERLQQGDVEDVNDYEEPGNADPKRTTPTDAAASSTSAPPLRRLPPVLPGRLRLNWLRRSRRNLVWKTMPR